MDKIWSLIIDVFIGLVIIFLAVATYFNIRTEAVKKSAVRELVRDFILTAKREGCITTNCYEHLMDGLSLTKEIYHLELEHMYEVKEPEYRFRTLEEILEAQNSSYTGSNEYHYRDVITTPPPVNDPVYTGELNTETNESVLASAVNTPADPGHVHNDACYYGTKHVHTGSPASGGGCYGEAVSSTPIICGSSLSGGDFTVMDISFKCSNGSCSGWCSGEAVYVYLKCGNGHTTTYTAKFEWSCDTCENAYKVTPGSVPTTCGYVDIPTGYKLNCGKIEGHYYNGDTEVLPTCNQKITIITATHPVQTVATGDPLITTVRATFSDGSTKVLLGTSGFSTAAPCQNQTAIISYTYTLQGNTYTLECSIDITVIPRVKTCSRGHVYNLNANGSDPGCPYCRTWVDNIRVVYPPTSTLTITIGTNLQQNGVRILVTYMDGRTETITSGYDDNLDSAYLGTKNVTIGYKGAVTYLMVTTVCARRVCEICGREYELYPDGTDPGCPYCIQKTPVFTGNILNYEEKVFTETVLKKLYAKGRYDMQTGDTFTLLIKNKSEGASRKLLKKIFPSLPGLWIFLKQSTRIGVK